MNQVAQLPRRGLRRGAGYAEAGVACGTADGLHPGCVELSVVFLASCLKNALLPRSQTLQHDHVNCAH